MSMILVEKNPKDLKISKWNVRKKFPDIDIERLTDSVVASKKVIEPILIDQNDEVIAGQRRLKASIKAELDSIYCVQKTYTNNAEKIYDSLLEGDLNVDIDLDDKTFALIRLRELGESLSGIASRLGQSPTAVASALDRKSVPQIIASLPREEKEYAIKTIDDMSGRRHKVYTRISNTKLFKEDIHMATKLLDYAKDAPLRELEDITKDARVGIVPDFETRKVIKESEEYSLLSLKYPRKLLDRLTRYLRINRLDKPTYMHKILKDDLDAKQID